MENLVFFFSSTSLKLFCVIPGCNEMKWVSIVLGFFVSYFLSSVLFHGASERAMVLCTHVLNIYYC